MLPRFQATSWVVARETAARCDRRGPGGAVRRCTINPLSNGRAGVGEAGEVMLPDALFFKAAKEAFDEAVLFGRVGRDELLAQTVIAAGGAKTSALKDEAVIRAHYRRRAGRAQRPEARQAGLF